MIDFAIGHFNSVTYIVLMMIGFYAMTGKTNLIEKLVGMNVFQWSVILFIVSLGAKRGATIPIVSAPMGMENHRPHDRSIRQPLASRTHADRHRGGGGHHGCGSGPSPPDLQAVRKLEEDVLLERIRSS